MPKKKQTEEHLRGVSEKEQRQYEHINRERRKRGALR